MKRGILTAFLFTTLGIAHAFGAPFCPSSTVSFQGNQDADDNEFMYTSNKAYNSAVKLQDDNGGKLKGGQVYECDKEQGCAYDSYFLTTSASSHKSKQPGDKKLYICRSGDDRWEQTSVSACNGFPQKYTDYTNKIVNLAGRDYVLLYDHTKYISCYLTGQALACFNYNKNNKDRVYWEDNSCKCKEYQGDEYVWKNNTCVKYTTQDKNTPQNACDGHKKTDVWSVKCNSISITNGKECKCRCNSNDTKTCFVTECNSGYQLNTPIQGDDFKKVGAHEKCTKTDNNNGGGNGNRVSKCHPSVCKSEICKACCAKPASEAVWMPNTQSCTCTNGGNFVKENNTWICKTNVNHSDNPQTYQCDKTKLSNLPAWKTLCASHNDILNSITELETYCSGKPNQEGFLELYFTLKSAVTTTCAGTQNTTIIEADITTTYNHLKSIHDKFNVTVWKDAEGNFNTARLASDSIAGVVLGTAGGLITSHVVKKNQVENGFEDIKCTIGGQNVAAWGDQFRVGIQ